MEEFYIAEGNVCQQWSGPVSLCAKLDLEKRSRKMYNNRVKYDDVDVNG